LIKQKGKYKFFPFLKKTVVFFLLGLVVLAQGGYFAILKYYQFEQFEKQQQLIRKQKGDYSKVTVSLDEYDSWKKSDAEIEIQGVMYDIATIHKHDGLVDLIMLKDDWETEINSMLDFFSNSDITDLGTQSLNSHLLLLMISPMIRVDKLVSGIQFFKLLNKRSYPEYAEHMFSSNVEVASPPPNLFI
jgi:hypothetical protein